MQSLQTFLLHTGNDRPDGPDAPMFYLICKQVVGFTHAGNHFWEGRPLPLSLIFFENPIAGNINVRIISGGLPYEWLTQEQLKLEILCAHQVRLLSHLEYMQHQVNCWYMIGRILAALPGLNLWANSRHRHACQKLFHAWSCEYLPLVARIRRAEQISEGLNPYISL